MNAQDLIAVQNDNTPSFYTDLSEAIDNATAGDTLYIPGRNYVINDTINKPLHLIGTGINPNYTLATGITTIASASSQPQLFLGDNADGGSMTGIHFTSGVNKNIETDNNNISNYYISRCYFSKRVIGNFLNSLFSQNIFRNTYVDSKNTNTVISYNIFVSYNNRFDNCLVANNIFLNGGTSNATSIIQYTNSSMIENNIFKYPSYAVNNSNNCNIRNNTNVGNGLSSTNIFSGNFNDSVDLTTVFINYSGTGDAVNFTGNFHLPGGSPYKNAGTDGKDLGIYGGRFPWKDGLVPFNPHVVMKNISGNTDENGNLQVEVEVQAQGN